MKNIILILVITISLFMVGCNSNTNNIEYIESEKEQIKTFTLGDTTFNAENEEPDIHPHNLYSGWATIRYGVGETLFRYSDKMELEPWLAEKYEQLDELTWKITIKEGIYFSSGAYVDGQAVKSCLEALVLAHSRAAGDLSIEEIQAKGQEIIITTKVSVPALLNYLSDPYGCIIDMNEGISEDGIAVGTGPYIAVKLNSGERLELIKNENYWNGKANIDKITILTISDGDTLTLALQAGEIDAAYGLPYASYPLFENENYVISSTPTSRTFFGWMNFESSIIQDSVVRKAIAMGIDKKGFVNTLLKGNGYVGIGPFPEFFSFGGDVVTTEEYDIEGAKVILEEAGWIDADEDGIREKAGEKLRLRILTYPSRQELPLLAEATQASLGEIGIEVVIQSSANHNTIRKDNSAWDVYFSAMTTAPIGDPEYFFTTCALSSSVNNNGKYYSKKLEELSQKLSNTFEREEREQIAILMQQEILNDNAYIFCSYLQMSLIAKANVSGFNAHPSDFYEITVDLDID